MRQIFFAVTFAVTLIFVETCAAADIWVENDNGVDVYVMDETVKNATPPSGHDYRIVTVSSKRVKNGQLQEIVKWTFSKITKNAWKYRTGETPEGVVIRDTSVELPAQNKVFEFSIKHLGWSYEIRDGYYY